MNDFYEVVLSLVPLLVTAIVVFLILYGAHWLLLGRYPGLGNERRLPRQITMLVASVVGAVVIALALPVSDSSRNQVISLIGLLLSGVIAFSSTTIVSNLMAGVMLRFTKSFRTGDFIRVAEHAGRVAERGLFDTEIQTEQRELVSLANTYLITHPVTVVRSSGTIISANMSLGYDVHHSRIRKLLLAAARNSGLEEPFVQVIELADFAISYRVSGLLTNVKSMLTARSNLNKEILDSLHGDGVEIVSPGFINQRRLGEGRVFVPASVIEVPASEQSSPEDLVFDKAEQAERREKAILDLKEELRGLEEQAKEVEGEERQRLTASIEEKRVELAALEQPMEEPGPQGGTAAASTDKA